MTARNLNLGDARRCLPALTVIIPPQISDVSVNSHSSVCSQSSATSFSPTKDSPKLRSQEADVFEIQELQTYRTRMSCLQCHLSGLRCMWSSPAADECCNRCREMRSRSSTTLSIYPVPQNEGKPKHEEEEHACVTRHRQSNVFRQVSSGLVKVDHEVVYSCQARGMGRLEAEVIVEEKKQRARFALPAAPEGYRATLRRTGLMSDEWRGEKKKKKKKNKEQEP